MVDAQAKRVQDILLRLTGLLLLAGSIWLFAWLFGSRVRDQSILEALSAAVAFVAASVGIILGSQGSHIFDRIRVSPRWIRHDRVLPQNPDA